jgi:putative ABC transport system permease protein
VSAFRRTWKVQLKPDTTAVRVAGNAGDAPFRLSRMSFAQDVLQALRLLRKAPWFTFASVVVLALGIGATTAIFSLVDAVLLRPLPLRDPHRLVMVSQRSASADQDAVAMLDFLDLKEQHTSFTGVAAAVTGGPIQVPLSDDAGGPPEIVALHDVTSTFFDVLGVTPIAGRTFSAQDDLAQSNVGLVMSERLWRTKFGADPAIIGRTIRISSPPAARPIIGIVPADFRLLGAADLWEHLPINRRDLARGQGVLQVIARLRPDATIEQARSDMRIISGNIERIAPATNTGKILTVEPLQQAVTGDDLRITSFVLGGVVLFVLLLACANVANLILARGVGRTREIALRSALGGTQARIARQLLTESSVLGLLGGLAGFAVAWASLRVAPSLIPPQTLPEAITLGIDWRLGLLALAVTFLTALLFGLVPAWQGARVSLVDAMNSGGRGSSDRGGRVRQALAVLEIATALLLLTGGGLLVRTLVSLNSVDAGYRADNVVTMAIRLPFRRLVTAKPGELGRYWQSIEDEVARLSGVRSAALGSDVPLGGGSGVQVVPFEIVGEPVSDPASRPRTYYQSTTPRYFATLGIPVVRGRGFDERDSNEAVPVAIVNEEFVRRYFQGRDPIGARVTVRNPLAFRSPALTREIVGVVPQVKARPDEPVNNALQLYVPLAQNNWLSPTLLVRTTENPMRMVRQIQTAIARADPTQAVARVRTMEAVAADATARPRFRAQLVSAFAVLAAVLAAIGIFSVLMFMVQQRAREFSVRLAIGASARDLLRLVLGDGLKLTAIGLAIGVAASAVLARSLGALLFGVAPIDPLTFLTAPLALTLVTMIACLAPAIRALRADPVAALRNE